MNDKINLIEVFKKACQNENYEKSIYFSMYMMHYSIKIREENILRLTPLQSTGVGSCSGRISFKDIVQDISNEEVEKLIELHSPNRNKESIDILKEEGLI